MNATQYIDFDYLYIDYLYTVTYITMVKETESRIIFPFLMTMIILS